MITAVRDATQVGEARRKVADFVRRLGQGEQEIGRAALVATELATNLVKHGGGGDLYFERFADRDGAGIEIMALDKGRGMEDLQSCLADGYSSRGSAGTGLGAVGRQSQRFAAFTRPGLGSVLMARLAFSDAAPELRGIELGAHELCYPGESVSGDRWAFAHPAAGPTLLMVDGTGHGPAAAAAAALAAELFCRNAQQECERLAETLHKGLTSTRGAAIAIARYERDQARVRFVGIGNISGTLIVGGETRHMVSHNGTAGHLAPRIRAFDYPAAGEPLILMHSDGLSTKWDLASYPGLQHSHASVVCGVLLRDHRRERDDSCVAAMRIAA